MARAHRAAVDRPAEVLVAAAQMNVVELHTWNSTVKAIDQPDRVIFDLDPGEGVPWAHVQEAALLTRTMLTELGLDSWVKTSGGKGLHVVVPRAPKLDYEVVNGFSRAVVQHMAKAIPQRFVAKSGGSKLRAGSCAPCSTASASSDTRPFQQIPFQFSARRVDDAGVLTQEEFLDLSGNDPSRGFAERLVARCGRSEC